jgi:hypothetical protein
MKTRKIKRHQEIIYNLVMAMQEAINYGNWKLNEGEDPDVVLGPAINYLESKGIYPEQGF